MPLLLTPNYSNILQPIFLLAVSRDLPVLHIVSATFTRPGNAAIDSSQLAPKLRAIVIKRHFSFPSPFVFAQV